MPRDPRNDAMEDRVRIEHMLEAACDVRAYMAGRSRTDLDQDSMLRRAVMNAIQQIGEAAASIGEEGRSRVPELPWGQIVAMRHVIVHVYWGIDLNRVWMTATSDIPQLIALLEHATSGWPMPPDDEAA